ncbi:MAG TPA: sulfotransferase domain-containing protein [Vicinamibacteria bacterium]
MIPTFFIAGAPRCGTSSLSAYLDAHPGIFMSKPKEPHHFGADLEVRSRVADRPAYLKLFEEAGDVQHAGEASVLTMYSRSAPAEILDASPAARVVIMLRDPLEMVPSLHVHNLLLNYEDVEDLARALEAQADRRAGRRVPASCLAPIALQYVHLARYADPVHRFREAFGPDRVRCILFEDLRRAPERVFAETVAFLGLPPAPAPELAVHNRGQRWRSQRAARLLLPVYARAVGVANRVPTRLLRKSALWTVVGLFYPPLRLNVRPARTPRLSRELRGTLREELRDDVARLADLLARDLSAWLKTDA